MKRTASWLLSRGLLAELEVARLREVVRELEEDLAEARKGRRKALLAARRQVAAAKAEATRTRSQLEVAHLEIAGLREALQKRELELRLRPVVRKAAPEATA